jgi:hypothetical protein
MFGRNQHEKTPVAAEVSQVLPTDGRQLSLLPGHDDDPEQPVRVLSSYAVESLETGRTTVNTELIWAQSVTDRPKRMRVMDVNELLLFLGQVVEKTMTRPTARAGRYIIEYPRASEADPIRGEVYMLGAQLMKYDFEENGDEITVTGAEAVMSAKERFELPVGARMTAAVSMKEEDADPRSSQELEGIDLNNIVNTEEPTEEEKFTARIKKAIGLYKTLHS